MFYFTSRLPDLSLTNPLRGFRSQRPVQTRQFLKRYRILFAREPYQIFFRTIGDALNPKKQHRIREDRYNERIRILISFQQLILWLSDAQTFFGVSYLAAAISQAQVMDYYHMEFAQGIVWLPCQAHAALFAYVLSPQTPFIKVRVFWIVVYLILYITFEILYVRRLSHADVDCQMTTTIGWIIVDALWNLSSYWPIIGVFSRRGISPFDPASELQLWLGQCQQLGICSVNRRVRVTGVKAWLHYLLYWSCRGPAWLPICDVIVPSFPAETPQQLQRRGWREHAMCIFRTWWAVKQVVFCLVGSGRFMVITMTIYYALQISDYVGVRAIYRLYAKSSDDERLWGFGQVVSVGSLVAFSFEIWKTYIGL